MDNIDANFMKVLEPMELISSRNGGPYAYRTKLGWCIVGPITTSRNDGSVKMLQNSSERCCFWEMTPHHFVLDDKPKIEDVDIKEMLEQCIIVTSVNVIICKYSWQH